MNVPSSLAPASSPAIADGLEMSRQISKKSRLTGSPGAPPLSHRSPAVPLPPLFRSVNCFYTKMKPLNLERTLDFLSIKELLVFETVCKQAPILMNLKWAALREANYLTINWSDCEGNPRQEKLNFLLSSIFTKYIHLKMQTPIKERLVLASLVYTKFKGLRKRFENFGYFLNYEMRVLASSICFDNHKEKMVRNNILEKALECKTTEGSKNSGDLLVQAIFDSCHDTSKALEYLELAINKGATYGSLLALQYKFEIQKAYHDKFSGEPDPAICEKLALKAAEQKDFRALDMLAKEFSEEKLLSLQTSHTYPSILFNLARFTEDPLKKESLFSQAIEKYAANVPLMVWVEAADNKATLNKPEEATALYKQVIAKYGTVVPAGALAKAAYYKAASGNCAEAEALYAQAIEKYGTEVPATVLADAAVNKSELKKYEEAEALFIKAFEKFGTGVPATVLADAANNKAFLDRHQEAEELYTQALKKFTKAPLDVLRNAACNKTQLNKHQEAEFVFAQIRSIYGTDLPADILAKAAANQVQLKKYLSAKIFYELALAKYGPDVPSDVLASAATNKALAAANKAKLNHGI